MFWLGIGAILTSANHTDFLMDLSFQFMYRVHCYVRPAVPCSVQTDRSLHTTSDVCPQIHTLSPAMKAVMPRFDGLITEESRQNASRFVPRPSDVIISTPMKCGTTWMQQIVHQLRSGGDMSFEDISDEVPWIEIAYDLEQDLNDEQKFVPRCFHTHECYETCVKGAKYIVIYREPCAAFYSAYSFFVGKFFQPEEITLDEFVKCMYSMEVESDTEIQKSNYFKHLLSWWPHRNDPNVLLLFYEDMLEDFEAAVRSVASFIGINNKASIRNAVKTSKFDFMKENEGKFLSRRIARYRNKSMGLPEGSLLKRVVTGSATKGREMMDECTSQAVQKTWEETITKNTGISNYSELRKTLKDEK